MRQIMEFLSAIYPVTDAVKAKLEKMIKYRSIRKGDYILKAGAVCENIYFIKTGLLRCYYAKDEREVSAWFMRENDTLVSVDSFYDQKPSDEYIQAVEDCELYYITYYELQDLFDANIEFNYNGRVLTLKYLRIWTRDLKIIRLLTASERYHELVERDPDLVRRVSSKHLASYLDMTPQTLSRIKKS